MPTPISRLTVAQFALLAVPSLLMRKITAVHLHHTWRPRHQDFQGRATIEAMRRVHMEQNGWSDIAQHLTIDPRGGLWTGRNWNWPPASAVGHNGTAEQGPFMIEMIGDFDTGRDPFEGAQRDSVLATLAHLLRAFKLDDDALKFHNQLTNQKTCPGTAISRPHLLKAVHKVPVQRIAARGPFHAQHLLGAAAVRDSVATDTAISASVPEHTAAGDAIEAFTREVRHDRQRRTRSVGPRLLGAELAPSSRDSDDFAGLKPFVINLAKGELSESGLFRTTSADVAAIVDSIRDYAETTDSPRLIIHAHGGLVSERSALEYARTVVPWWRSHGVYPLLFVWETSLLEILGQFVIGRRDVFDFTTDPAIEAIVKAPGTAAWAGMKESARLAASRDTGEGAVGGARLFAQKLGATSIGKTLSVHAIGHSAGAIFHAHFIPALLAENIPSVEHLYLLAPAVRAELFAQHLAPLVSRKTIQNLSMFTMEEEAEEQDDCFKVYRKSLLYLVSHACEGFRRRPILGLHKSLRKDPDLRELFGLDANGSPTGKGMAQLHLSFARGEEENPLTRALAHGAFDNDPKTMSSVLRRVLGVSDETGLGEADFPFPALERSFDFTPPSVGTSFNGVSVPIRPTESPASPPAVSTQARIKALCIGINSYPARPLDGCVNDARSWGNVLAGLGAKVDYLLDADATAEGMKRAIRSLVQGGRAGDVLVLQYAGHGGQLPNRVDSEADGFNEALIPVDFNTGALLVDDELADILRGLAPGVTMTLFMDCCHSGTNSRFAPIMRARAAAGDKPRFMPLDDDIVAAFFSKRAARGRSRGGDIALPGIVHYAACQDYELAWESNGQGDFTVAAVTALSRAVRSATSNEALAQELATALAGKQRQHPQLMELEPSMRNRAVLAPPAV